MNANDPLILNDIQSFYKEKGKYGVIEIDEGVLGSFKWLEILEEGIYKTIYIDIHNKVYTGRVYHPGEANSALNCSKINDIAYEALRKAVSTVKITN